MKSPFKIPAVVLTAVGKGDSIDRDDGGNPGYWAKAELTTFTNFGTTQYFYDLC